MKDKKKKKRKLKLTWWQDLIYLLLILGGPILTIYLASAIHNPEPKYISFMTLFFLGVLAWILIKKFIINPWKIKINAQIATLELNYQTLVGDPEATKGMWKSLQLKKFFWDAGTMIFFAFVIYYVVVGIKSWMDHLTLYALIIFLCILLGLLFRLICFTTIKKTKEEENEDMKQLTQGK